MTEDNRTQRASSFGAVAGKYDEHRPGYPEDAIRWALAPVAGDGTAGDIPGDAGLAGLQVLDLGAGTGKLTMQLVRLGLAVAAVEPDPSMLARLRRQLPSVPSLGGSAESIPLPDGSVRAVLCGQAMHWFDLERAVPEIARVLAPGGVLAALWNTDDDRVKWVSGLHAAAEGSAGPRVSDFRAQAVEAGFAAAGDGAAAFGPTEIRDFPHGYQRTADTLIAAVGTHSRFLTASPGEQDRLLGQVTSYVRSRPETEGEFTFPLVTQVLRAQRQ
jgi:SAM-dependent methyltransferase